jgi:monofunctional biosynthetic peptidoglycan transglycosylase
MWLALGLSALAVAAYALHVWSGLPERSEIGALARINPDETSIMRQRFREALRSKRRPTRVQYWVPLSRVSRHLIVAVIEAEDPKFFGHEGVDWDAVRESIEQNVKKRRFARGASTITQQLAKNLFFTTRKSITRKAREFFVARWIDDELSKRRILEIYLNVIEWGDGIYGCEAAARVYYGKSAALLTNSEAAGLTAMIPSPLRINPRVNPERHARAQRRILRLMARSDVNRQARSLGAPAQTPSPTPEPPAAPQPENENGQES